MSYSQIEAPCKTVPSQNAVTIIPAQIQQNVDLSATHYFRVNAHLFPNSSPNYDITEEDVHRSLNILDAAFNPHGIYFVRECAISEWDFIGTTSCSYLNFNLLPDNTLNILFLDKSSGEPQGVAADVGSDALVVRGNYHGLLNYEGDLPTMFSTTMIHEMGHCLGLYHTHHNNPADGFGLSCLGTTQGTCVECVNGDSENRENCGDLVKDTNPSGLGFGEVLPDCSYDNPGETDESGECIGFGFGTYMPQVNNYMNYAWPQCRDAFTPGQVERMFCTIDMVPDLQAALISPDEEERIIPAGTTEVFTIGNAPKIMNGDLIVEEDAELTIESGVTIEFCESCRVIVKPGATLRLYGKLTGWGCNFNWRGIEVWGDSNSSQYVMGGSYAQGRFIGYPESEVRRAKTGIRVYSTEFSGKTGGIVQCDGTTFENNATAVDFESYQNFYPFSFPSQQTGQPQSNYSWFKNCTFTANNIVTEKNTPFIHLLLVGVNGISIRGCHFGNEYDGFGSSEIDWGYGIVAYDAGFRVSGLCYDNVISTGNGCLDYQKTTFDNLGYGIYNYFISEDKPFTVKSCVFNQCFVGLRNETVTGGTILYNEFNLGEIPAQGIADNQYGICMEGATSGFTLEENRFNNASQSPNTRTVGIYCRNTGDINKIIRRNTFQGMTYANLTEGNNGQPSPNIRGLYYECNNNLPDSEQDYDFKVNNGTIRLLQGTVNEDFPEEIFPTGNKFSYTGIDLGNAGSQYEYYYYSDGTNEKPVSIEGNVSDNSVGEENTCESTFCEFPCLSEVELNGKKTKFYENKNKLVTAIGGNEISEQNNSSVGLYQRLMDESAYAVVVHEMYDTVSYNKDTLYHWINNLQSFAGDTWLALEQFGAGNHDISYQILSEFPAKKLYTDEQVADRDDLLLVMQQLRGKSLFQLSKNDLQDLEKFADNRNFGFTQSWVQNILSYHGYHYPVQVNMDKAESRTATQIINNIENDFTIYPNPATAVITISHQYQEPFELIIYNIHGVPVKTTNFSVTSINTELDVSDLPTGVYFYHVRQENKLLTTGKLILQ